MLNEAVREWRIRKARFELEKSGNKKGNGSRLSFKSIDLINDVLRDFREPLPVDLAAELSTEVIFCWKEIGRLVQCDDINQIHAALRGVVSRLEGDDSRGAR